MADFIQDYFLNPIHERTGYNAINTLVYVAIALVAAYAIYWLLEKQRIKIDKKLISGVIPFILLGSTFRVLVDSVDAGVAQANRDALFGLFGKIVVDSGIYNYGYLTVTPGIYVVTGLLTLASVLFFYRMKKPALLPLLGLALWLPNLLLLAPLFKNYAYALLIICLAAAPALLAIPLFRKLKIKLELGWLAVFSHALDGGATFVILDFYNRFSGAAYFEQHVLGRGIGDFFGTMLPFYLIKVAFAAAAVHVLNREENMQEKNYVLLLIIIFGLAPGVRDLLRLLAGT